MAVTNIPNVQNWTVTPQNGQPSYFTLMNTWLGQSTLVIASLQTAITAQNTANSEINALAIQTENNAIIATGLANFQGAWSSVNTYSKGQSVESTTGSKIYYTSKVNNNLNRALTDTNYWLYNPINDKMALTGNQTVAGNKNFIGNLLMTGSSSIIGYGTGSGGTVTQATSKKTLVTLNKPTGQITMSNSALATSAKQDFAFYNNLISLGDTLFVTAIAGSTVLEQYETQTRCADGVALIIVWHTYNSSLSEPIVLQFTLIKGANS